MLSMDTKPQRYSASPPPSSKSSFILSSPGRSANFDCSCIDPCCHSGSTIPDTSSPPSSSSDSLYDITYLGENKHQLQPAQPSSKASQEVLVITDSSDVDLDDIETQDRSQQDQTPELSDVEAGEPQDARAPTRHSVDDSFSDTDNVVVDIPKPTERLHETLADDSESANSSRSSPSSSPRPRQDMDVSSDHEAGAGEAHVQDNDVQILLEEEAELPVIIDVRLAAAKEQELVSRIGTDSLSESDAEGSRRYPRRARAIQDYNLAGLFERSFAPPIDTSADVRSIATVAPPPKPKRTKFPVVEASQDFFDALRGSVPSSTQNHDESDGWTPEMTLEEYIQSRVVAAAKEAGNRYVPNRDDVQDLLDLPLSLASQWHLPVAKDDGKIEQLESSTRRWLGLKGSKIMQHLREPSSPLPPSDPSIKTAKLTGPLLSRISKTPDSISLRVKALSLPDSHLILRDMEANSIESAETRLRIARSSRIPLPALLRTFISYLEDEEWDRLEAIQAHCLKARQIQKRGRTSDDDDFDTEWDTLGRKRSVRMHTAAGGEIRIHFATPTPETEVPKDAKSSAEVQLSVQPTLVKRSEVPVSTPRVSTTRLDKGKQRADQAADISASSRLAPPTKVLQVTSSSSSDSRISLVWPGLPAAPSTLSSSLSQKTKAPEIGKVSKQVPSNTTGPSTKASSLRTSPVTLPQPKYKPVVQPSPASSTKASASSARTSPVTLPQPKYKPAVQPPPTSSTKASVPLTQAPSSKKAAPSTSAIGSKSVLTNDKLQTSRTSSSLTSKPGSSRLESTTKAGTLDLTSYFGKQSPPKPHPSSPPIGIVVEIPSEDSGSEVARGKKRMRSVSPSNTTRATVKTTDKIISTSKRPALDVLALQQEKRDRMRRRLEHGSRRVDTEPSSESSVLVELPSEPAAHGSSEDEYLFQQRRNDPLDLFSKSNKSRSQNETMSLVIGHPDSSSEKNRKAVGKTSSASASRSATESQAAKARTISRTSDRNMAPDSDWEDDEESAAPEVKKRVTLPDPTPSPSKGGWAGVSGWYRTRDAFTPTPDIRIELQKQAREERKRQLQAEHLPQGTDPKKRKERK